MKLIHAAASAALLLALLSPLHAQGGQYLYGGFEDLGGGTPGFQSQIPELFGTGTCSPGTTNNLGLFGAMPNSGLSMVTGYVMNPQYVLGGVLWPTPDIVIPLTTDANGHAELNFAWPAFTAGIPLYFQAAVLDPYAVEGMAFSNLVRGETAGWGLYEENPFLVTDPYVQIIDSETFVGVPQVQLDLDSAESGIDLAAISDMQGLACFPNLIVETGVTSDPDEIPGSKAKTWASASATAPGYVPALKQIYFTEDSNFSRFWMVPLSSGEVTPLVSAAAGGTFVLQGIGTLHIPAGVITQDAHVRVVPIPAFARDPRRIDTQLLYQVWVGAEDSQGQQLSGVLPTSHSAGMTLTVNLPECAHLQNAAQIHATSYSFDADGTVSESSTSTTEGPIEFVIRVVGGESALGAWYAFLDQLDCECGAWKSRCSEGVAYVAAGSVDVNCGQHANNSPKVEIGAKHTNASGWQVGAEVGAKLGWEGNLLLTAASAEASLKITGTITGSTVVTEHAAVSDTIKGGSEFRPGLPNNGCLSGCHEIGIRYKTYRFEVFRKCKNSGPACYEVVHVGTLYVPDGVAEWMSVLNWDTQCGGACGTPGTIPSNIRVANTENSRCGNGQ